MTDKKEVRASLERLLASSFSDYQWSLIVAQGYEDAMLSGARTAEDVAVELRGLIEAASASAAGADGPGGMVGGSKLTWDEMEKLVLGRILATREVEGPRLVLGPAGDKGKRVERLYDSRERSRRQWWIVLGSCLSVLVVALVAVLVFGGLECGSEDAASTMTVTTDSARTGVEARILPLSSSTTTTDLPPETIPELKLPDYTAQLTGAEVVPAVNSKAGGTLELTLSEDGQTLSYMLILQDLEALTVARLRLGGLGVNGDEICTLYPGPNKKGVLSGVAAEGTLSAQDLVGPLEGKTMADLLALMEEGSVYVVVGSAEHKSGELRGQVK